MATRVDIEKLELLGNSYLLDFIGWEIEKERGELTYRTYLTDILRASSQWETPPERYIDLLSKQRPKQSNNNTQEHNTKEANDILAKQVKSSILEKLNRGRGEVIESI